jgi:hypothetical protein
MKSAVLPVVLLLSLSFSSTRLLAASPMKGVGEYSQPHGAEVLAGLNVSWYYDWRPRPDVSEAPAGVEFIPMIWGPQNLNAADLAAAKASGAGIVLGFNEPNESSQSNMTVEQALDAWPKLEALGMRLGSPAVGTGDDVKPDGWLARFMAGAKQRGYRVDFLCLHPYQSSFDPETATRDLVRELTEMHDRYHLPIWVTEYAIANWEGKPVTPDAATEAKFVRESTAAMDKLPFVERYAWFGAVTDQPYFSTNEDNGDPTPVGKAWSAAH